MLKAVLYRIFKLIVFILWLIVVGITFLFANYFYFNFSATEFHPAYKLPGKILTVDGRNIHYIEKGSGPPVIMIHDIGFSAETLEPAIEKLAVKYRVIVPDLLGHGYTDRPKDVIYNADTYVNNILQLLFALKVNKASFIAHGNSTIIVDRLISGYPGKVGQVVYVDSVAHKPSFMFDDLLARPLLGEGIVTFIDRMIMKRFLYDYGYYNHLIIQEKDIDIVSKYWGIPGTRYAYLNTARQFIKNSSVSLAYSKNRAGLLLFSEIFYQKYVKTPGYADLGKKIDPWKFRIIPGTGYFSFREKPDLFAAEIMRYLH